MAAAKPVVFIIVYQRRDDLRYGSSLIFDSIRTGFPTSDIFVIDNGSPADTSWLDASAVGVGARLGRQAESEHWKVVRDILVACTDRPVVVLDPDVVFWANCESWAFDRPLAGRVIPTFNDPYSKCITHARPHTLFLWISDPAVVLDAGAHLRPEYDPLRPVVQVLDGRWNRWDTTAALYAAYPDLVQSFTEYHLSHYDHLFCGSHIDAVADRLPDAARREMVASHIAAQGDPQGLRGIWRTQQAFFQSLAA